MFLGDYIKFKYNQTSNKSRVYVSKDHTTVSLNTFKT